MTSVNEEKFRRPVLGVLRALLLSDLGEIPDVQSPISARAGQDSLVMGRPLDLWGTMVSVNSFDDKERDLFYLENLVLVALEAVQFELEVPEVPEGHGLVRGAGGEDELRVRVETQTVDLNTAELITQIKKTSQQLTSAV